MIKRKTFSTKEKKKISSFMDLTPRMEVILKPGAVRSWKRPAGGSIKCGAGNIAFLYRPGQCECDADCETPSMFPNITKRKSERNLN